MNSPITVFLVTVCALTLLSHIAHAAVVTDCEWTVREFEPQVRIQKRPMPDGTFKEIKRVIGGGREAMRGTCVTAHNYEEDNVCIEAKKTDECSEEQICCGIETFAVN